MTLTNLTYEQQQMLMDLLAERDAAEARVAELEAALRRIIEVSGTSQLQCKIAQAALKGEK